MLRTTFGLLAIGMAVGVGAGSPARGADPVPAGGVFARSNLVAWCIVPFDAARRGPPQRAEMLQRLGIGKFAYDWRNEHVPAFEEEIVQVKQHGLEYFAFWGFHPDIVPLIRKHGVHPQFWITISGGTGVTQEQKVEAAAQQLLPLVKQTRELGCQVGIYNHGGWGGEPANMVAVVERLRQGGEADHVGIVYNFHHGHEHIRDFAEVLAAMKPYLICLNLNGMNDNAQPKILPIGSGRHEQAMMQAIQRCGYTGPIGILNHQENVDAEVGLSRNIEGLKQVLEQLGDEAALKTYR